MVNFHKQDLYFQESIESDISQPDEPERCGRCEDAEDLISHLEDNPVCCNAYMRQYLPQRWWQDRYLNDRALLLLDLSVCLQICLNTGSCARRGEQIRNWPVHLTDNPCCFQYYRSHSAIVHHVTRGTMPDMVSDIGQRLGGRRSNILRTKEEEGLIGVSGFRAMMDKQMAVKCYNCGLLGPVDVRLNVTRSGGLGPTSCKSCAKENNRDKFTVISLALQRGNFWNTNVEEEQEEIRGRHGPEIVLNSRKILKINV